MEWSIYFLTSKSFTASELIFHYILSNFSSEIDFKFIIDLLYFRPFIPTPPLVDKSPRPVQPKYIYDQHGRRHKVVVVE